MGLGKKTARNSIYNLVAFTYPIILSFITTPFIIKKLGPTGYGIFALATSFVGFLAFVDFGVSPALVKYVAEHNARGEKDAINRFFSTSVIFYALVGTLIGIGIMIFGSTGAASFFKVPANEAATLRAVFYWSGLGFLFTLLLGAYASLPGALQRFDIPSRISMVINTISVALTVVLVAIGKGVVSLMALTTLLGGASVLIFRYFDKKLIPGLKVRPIVDRDVIRKLFVFGGYATLGTIGGTILFQFDKILIGSLQGAAAVAFYVIPGNMAIKINAAIATITAVIFPLSAELLAKGEHEKVQSLYTRATRITLTLIVLFVTPMYILSHAFLMQWLGLEYALKSTLVMQILLATYSILGLSNVATHLIVGAGKPKAAAVISGIAAVINVALLYILIPHYGIIGASWAFLISVLPLLVFIGYVERTVVKMKTMLFYMDTAKKLAIPFILGLTISYLLKGTIHNLISFLLVYILSVLISAVSMFIFRLIEPLDMELITAGLAKLTGRGVNEQ